MTLRLICVIMRSFVLIEFCEEKGQTLITTYIFESANSFCGCCKWVNFKMFLCVCICGRRLFNVVRG